ncbi:MAG: DUF1552 domain-containing protein [Polyangiaceae bacterium]|jgi:hypothetical protein|nr:DUF1552 domain-containing protein [Polyangiaceae bacterium]
MTKVRRINRRHFLVGAGGVTLAIPFLSSLEEKKAFAGAPPYAQNPRFVCMATPHGGVWNQHMWPDEATAAQARQVYPGHQMHWGELAPATSGGTTSLSACLSAPSTSLTASLISKMNVIRGLDYSFYLGHHRGGILGDVGNNNDEAPRFERVPTIDQVMAWSPSFYPDIANIKLRSMHVSRGYDGLSSTYANPVDKTGPVNQIPAVESALLLFQQIFVPPPEAEENPRPLIVDKVHEHYRRLHAGQFGDAKRLSSKDKQLLEAHMERLYELDRKLNVTASCGDVQPPTDDAHIWDPVDSIQSAAQWFQIYNDVIVAAFMCGTSRIAVIGASDELWKAAPFAGDWHQQIAHVGGGGVPINDPDGAANRPAWQDILVGTQREFFANVFLDLCNKLEQVEESDGITFLDNSLVMWSQESGNRTHDNVSTPVITAGSAAGFFNTGRYLDFRNRQNTLFGSSAEPASDSYRPGVLYNQWLANVLRANNVQPEEFERNDKRGYGEYEVFDLWSGVDPYQLWPDHLRDGASDLLPELVKGV